MHELMICNAFMMFPHEPIRTPTIYNCDLRFGLLIMKDEFYDLKHEVIVSHEFVI